VFARHDICVLNLIQGRIRTIRNDDHATNIWLCGFVECKARSHRRRHVVNPRLDSVPTREFDFNLGIASRLRARVIAPFPQLARSSQGTCSDDGFPHSTVRRPGYEGKRRVTVFGP
jgi:hypothetical protein